MTGWMLALALLAGPEPARLEPTPEPEPAPLRVSRDRRAHRLLIGGGVLWGLALAAEVSGAAVATTCEPGRPCALGVTFTWGSASAGTRYTVFSAGPGSAYLLGRGIAIPLVTGGEALVLSGTHLHSEADHRAGLAAPFRRRQAWGLTGTGLGIYALSRLARIGFALGGVCQEPRCVYTFDQLTLGSARALAFPGSAMLIYLRTRSDLQLGLVPASSFGLAVAGRF